MILSAVYMLWMFQRVNYGAGDATRRTPTLPDLQPREWAVLVPIVRVAIVMGVLPEAVPAADGAGRRRWSSSVAGACSQRARDAARGARPPADGARPGARRRAERCS